MRVYVLSKIKFDQLMKENEITDENVEKKDQMILISIVDTDKFSKYGEHYFKEDHENVINLSFDDCEHDNEASPTQKNKTKAFSEEQAEKLFNFIKKHKDKKTCVVHCIAGISRSAGIATFINNYCGGNWEEFKRTNPQICPNAHVHRMLNHAKYNDLNIK